MHPSTRLISARLAWMPALSETRICVNTVLAVNLCVLLRVSLLASDSLGGKVMNTPTPVERPSQPQPAARSRVLKRVLIGSAVVGSLILLAGGFAVGMVAGRSPIPGYQHQVAQTRSELKAEDGKLSTEESKLSSEQTQLSAAQAAAKNAMSTAQAQVSAQYRSRMASAQSLQRKLEHEQSVVQASTISSDGVYVVGQDIPAGTYHTSGLPAGASAGGGDQCYFATLGSTDTSNILDNNNFNGPETVDVSGAYAFQISGGCTWVKVG
jgi:hypothetical protein